MLAGQNSAVINLIKSTSHSDNVAANPAATYLKLQVQCSGLEEGKHLRGKHSSPPLCYVIPKHQD